MTSARTTARLPSCTTDAPNMPSNLPIVITSTTRGTFVRIHSSPPRIVEAKSGKAEFLAPLTCTSPHSGVPPVMTMRSIIRLLFPRSFDDHDSLDVCKVTDKANWSIPADCFYKLAHRLPLACPNLHDQRASERPIATRVL